MTSTAEEFQKLADKFLAKAGNTKKGLALKLEIDPSYFSRLYHGRGPVIPELLEKLQRILNDSTLQFVQYEEKIPHVRDELLLQLILNKLDLILKTLELNQKGPTPAEAKEKNYRVTFDVKLAEENHA